ncbi:PREDICTED: uncharacterized protein LOC109240317 [Nicotiana attenuata]|uniref:uncharacterized protein LOC109240317 n=1 Tax=Nicotiana attenuata TaxID=49451 RepID=UPI0009056AA2|nr:PREDICTED: uncharacterized protein LOC109240317 [Nicotiana attenuata]
MSLGLTNAPVAFMHLMNNVFQPYLDYFVNVFIDDILVYSCSWEDLEQHLKIMLQTFRERKLFAEFSNCDFWLDSMAFLGDVVSGERIKVDPKKIETIYSWPRPSSTTKIRTFLGLVGYYRCFVEGFSSIMALLTRLTQKGAPFKWFDECGENFEKINTALTTVPVLSKPHEKSYLVHDLELVFIVHALKILRHYLYDVSCKVFIRHRSLQHLFKQKDLNLRQRRWLEILKDYDITILFPLGKDNVMADSLSRKAESMGSLAYI